MSDHEPPSRDLDRDRALEHDQAERRRLVERLDESVLVEASAGAGKTTVLIERLVAALVTGRVTIERVVAVTFTRKAATELKVRLRRALVERLAETGRETSATVETARIEAALRGLEEASVSTLHGLCADILRRYPIEAGLDPQFRELDESAAAAVLDRVVDAWLAEPATRADPVIRRVLARQAARGRGPESLRWAARDLDAWRDFDSPWHADDPPPASEREALLEAALALDAKRRLGRPRDPLRRGTRALEPLAEWVASERAASRELDPLRLEAELAHLHTELERERNFVGRGEAFAPELPRAVLVAERDAFLDRLVAWLQATDAALAAGLERSLRPVLHRFAAWKRRNGRVDYLDLLLLTRDLLRDHPQIESTLQSRWDLLLLDEAQDADPLQLEVVLRLSGRPATAPAATAAGPTDWRDLRPVAGKLVWVGDPQQSIYRWRRADPALYAALADRLEAHGVRRVRLTRTFRSVAGVRRAIDGAFTRAASSGPGRLSEWVSGAVSEPFSEPPPEPSPEAPLEEFVPLLGDRPDPRDQPSVVVLPVPSPFGWSGRVTKGAIETSWPGTCAAFVDWLVNYSQYSVAEPTPDEPTRRVPIAPRHVALLFRRFTSWRGDVAAPYIEAFAERGIATAASEGRRFADRDAVQTVAQAAAAIERLDDPVAVHAVLRGGLFGFDDGDLLAHRWASAEGPKPSEGADPAILAAIDAARSLLAKLHAERHRRPIAATLGALFDATRADAGFALRPDAASALRAVDHLLALAREADGRGEVFGLFVDRLEAATAGRSVLTPPPLWQATEPGAVLFSSVHQAKGLEFPVVVLADPTCRFGARAVDHIADPGRRRIARRLLGMAPQALLDAEDSARAADRAEAARLAYVAATRARDLLVMPGVGAGDPPEGWLEPLAAAVQPLHPEAEPDTVPGAPPFGRSTVLDPPRDGLTEPAVRPGLHDTAAGPVAWWDPAALPPRPRGLRDGALDWLAEGPAADAGLDAWLDFRSHRERALERGAEPSRERLAPTDLPRESTRPDPAHELPLPTHALSPAGRELLRAVLARWHLLDDPVDHARRVARRAGLEISPLLRCLEPLLEHPAFDPRWPAEHAVECVAPLLGRRLVHGTIDRRVATDDGLWIVIWPGPEDPTESPSDRLLDEASQSRRLEWALEQTDAAAPAGAARARGLLVRFASRQPESG